jgi:hypothetical protein
VIADRERLLSRAAVLGWVLVLSAVLLWPITRGGYLLGHDMVFTPKQPLDLASVGVSSASPRAVPLDALVALAERVADGSVVGRLALLTPLLAAGLGTAALLGSRSLTARLAASGVAVWNPYVVERLALGQWALLWCYAALPWIVLTLARSRGRSGWLACGVAIAAASITPTGGLIAAVTAIAVTAGLRRPRREVLAAAALAAVLQLPWLLPAAVSTASATSDPGAVAAFAARSEHAGGVLFSLLGGGGIWDADVVPGSRGGALPWLWLIVLLAAAGFGTRQLVALLGRRLITTLVVLAGVGLAVALLPSVPGGAALVRAAVAHVPGAGLLRDAQKWIMPLVLVEALAVGAAVDRLAERMRGAWRGVLVVVALALPAIVLPDAAATLRPTLEPVHYPSDWATVSRLARGGDAAVLPFSSYRTYSWAPGRASVLDPAPRLLQVPTVVQDRLAVSGHLLKGEDPRAAAVATAMRADDLPAALARLGIRWVVVERDTPGPVPELSSLTSVYAGVHVALYRVPGDVPDVPVAAWRVGVVVAGDSLAVGCLAALLLRVVAAYFRRRRSALL